MAVTSSTKKSLLLIGPQRSKITPKAVTELRAAATTIPELSFLQDAIAELELAWLAIVKAHSELKVVRASETLQNLRKFFEGAEELTAEDLLAGRSNILLDVLTTLSHVVDLWILSTTKFKHGLFTSTGANGGSDIQEIQGFCIGFLTAAAASSSNSKNDFQQNIKAALCLALVAGALVELDGFKTSASSNRAISLSVGWHSESDYNILKDILRSTPSGYISCVTDRTRITITVPAHAASSFVQTASGLGLSVQNIELQGRYHRQLAHEDSLLSLKDLIKKDSRFHLPNATNMRMPLRSNATGDIILAGDLHEVALECILLQECNWFQTVQKAVTSHSIDSNGIVSVGADATIPRSIKHPAVTNGNVNGVDGGLADGVPSSISTNIAEYSASYDSSAVAVIGMACRYPDADSLEEFWDIISAGKSTLRPIPENRFRPSEIKREPKNSFLGNFLRNPDQFDHRFFGISGREAKYMDPQQRLVLQVAYEALESAGYFGVTSSLERFPSDIGCYLGVGSVDYEHNIASHDAAAFSALGTLRAFISGRISHHFGWSGPSITYDTACSSGAVAIHSAVNAIRSKECSIALAGGVNVITSPALFQNLAAASFLSPTGASKAFDAAANGYCRGEGAGLVLLKPLAKAMADGDSVLAVISGSAVNQGSNCSPITVPASDSQCALYRKALSISGTTPHEVSFVEAHGTGTLVGDPIECESIRRVFGSSNRTDTLFVGSVKDNVGHTEASSGAAALIKTILMMQKRLIPKQANFTKLNPNIPPLEPDHMAVPQRTEPWSTSKRIAVVNNYGAAGSNAALVVQDINLTKGETMKHTAPIINVQLPFFISASTPENVIDYCAVLQKRLQSIEQSHGASAAWALAYNLSTKQNWSLEYRYMFAASSLSDVTSNLNQVNTQNIKKLNTIQRPVVLCIGGQNGQTVHLDETLFQNSKVLQRHLNDCEHACRSLGLPSLFPAIFKTDVVDDLVNLHCMLFALQYSSAKSWLDAGLQVNTIIGHSFGQLTALVISNALSLLDGLRLISERARLIQQFWGQDTGAMLSIQGDKSVIEELLTKSRLRYAAFAADVACYNGADCIVMAGDRKSVEIMEGVANAETLGGLLKLVRLKCTHAFHSSLMDPILPGLREVAKSLNLRRPTIPIEACATNQNWNEVLTPEIIVKHSRDPVYFDTAVQHVARRLESPIFIEAGSASPIIPMTHRVLAKSMPSAESLLVPIDIGSPNALDKLSLATSSLWNAGVKVQFWPFCGMGRNPSAWINLPPYQFQKNEHWMPYIEQSPMPVQPATIPVKDKSSDLVELVNRSSQRATFKINTSHEMFELCTSGHAVLGQSLCPASMYVEIAVQSANLQKQSSAAPHVRDLKISSPLSISSSASVFLQLAPVSTEPDTWEFTITTGESNAKGSIKHATGVISLLSPDKPTRSSKLQFVERLVDHEKYEKLQFTAGSNSLSGKIVYQVFGQVVDYATYYRGVDNIVAHSNLAMGVVKVLGGQASILSEAKCHPIILDNYLQVAGIHVNCLSEKSDDDVFVCTELEELILDGKFMTKRQEGEWWNVYSSFKRTSSKTILNDIFVFDRQTGDILVTFLGAVFQAVPIKSLAKTLAKLNNALPSNGLANGQAAQASRTTFAAEKETTTQPNGTQKLNGVNHVANGVNHDQIDTLQRLRELLSKVLEIPAEDIQPTATLAELGIDSLMSTEVLNEIKIDFDMKDLPLDFMAVDDVQELAGKLGATPVTPGSVISVEKTNNSLTNGDNGQVTGNFAFSQVQELLGDILEIPLNDITADTLLSALGIDSLMATELLAEISKSFGVTIAQDDLKDFETVGVLASHIGIPGPKEWPAVKPSARPNGTSNSQVVDTTEAEVPFSSVACDSFLKVSRDFDIISTDTNLKSFYTSVYPAQKELVAAYVVEAFDSLGCPLASLAAGDRISDISILAKHDKVKRQLYRILEDSDIIEQDGLGSFTRTAIPVPQTSSAKLHQAIISRFPQHNFEHNLLASTGSKLASCLTGQIDPLSILFGNAQARTLMGNVYAHAPMFRTGTINLANYLVDIARRFKENRPIRILELGAGTGGTTKYLIEALTATQQAIEYTFTDLSASLVAAARKNFARYSFMKYSILNIEQEPDAQFLGQYDIVLSTNCIHATSNLTRSCTNINKVLRPNGVLCLVELTRNLYWFDLVFGLLEGWWLFEDGRQHALANELLWKKHLSHAGFHWMDWTKGDSEESTLLRVITASPSDLAQVETVEFKKVGDVSLQADLYYPRSAQKALPVALMIHGGGHVMLSRKDIRPPQTKLLLDAGFLPVSVDYRLCPEMTIQDGPMQDVCDALSWCRNILPTLKLARPDIQINGTHVVAVGWSTGGHLALTLGFTAPQAGLQPPDATLAFYCPSDYEDPFWTKPNLPFGQGHDMMIKDILEGVYDHPITAYNPPPAKKALGGWMAPSDSRSRIALHMNVKGRALRVLLNGLSPRRASDASDPTEDMVDPDIHRIQSISPLAQIRNGTYQVPTFIIHGTEDDLIPWQQALRTHEALQQQGVATEIRILDGAVHLFDLYRSYERNEKQVSAVQEGYEFLCRYGLP